MSDSLKKGIATKYLLPIVTVYVATAAWLGLDRVTAVTSVLQHLGVAAVGGLILLVLQEVVPRSVKEALVFFRFKDRLPGCRAFSVIAARDQRIDPVELGVLLPSVPMSGVEQNALWYRWLKSVESDPAIADNHHRFLALRDAAVLLFLLGLTSPFLAFIGAQHSGWFILGCGSLAAYLLTAVAARNSATRLVANVIARKVGTTT